MGSCESEAWYTWGHSFGVGHTSVTVRTSVGHNTGHRDKTTESSRVSVVSIG